MKFNLVGLWLRRANPDYGRRQGKLA
jgi:hypothetical protein